MRIVRNLSAALLGVAAITACSSAGGSYTSVEMWDSAGATIVQSHEPTWAEDEAWLVSPEPELTIGLLQGAAEYQLVNVTAAARQSDGDIVLVDGGVREVRLYDHEGTYVRTLGRAGSGPGEFQNPTQVLVSAADSVLVWDNAFYRVSRFDSAGAFASAQSVDRGWIAKAIDPPLYPGSADLLPDGQLVVRLVEKTLLKGGPAAASRPRSGALKVSVDLSRIDTLMFVAGIEQVSVDAPWGQASVVPPLAKRTVTAVGATKARTCIGEQEGPEVVCFGPDASRTIVRWASEPAPVTEREIATWRDTTVAQYTQKLSRDAALQVLNQVPAPTSRPPYARILLDRAGNLWVESGRANGTAPETMDYFVFNPTGAWLGVVALPPIEVLEIGDDYVLGIYRDELDIQYLQVHELVKWPVEE